MLSFIIYIISSSLKGEVKCSYFDLWNKYKKDDQKLNSLNLAKGSEVNLNFNLSSKVPAIIWILQNKLTNNQWILTFFGIIHTQRIYRRSN